VRRRPALLAGLLLCLLGVAIAAVTAASDRSSPAATPRRGLLGPRMPAHFAAGNFTLRDQAGRPFSLQATRGRVVVMTFLHSQCHSTCIVTAQVIRGALDDLGSARSGVDSVALSVAPKEDTARHVRAFLRLQDAGFLHYLTGPPAGLRRAWKRYGVHPLTQGEDHTAFVFLIDRRGIIRVGYPSHEMTAEDLAHDLRVLLAERG
jgi:protein SCO1/2